MTPQEIAKAILTLLGPNGENWCKGQLAKTKHDYETEPNDCTAAKWCLSGAAMRVSGYERDSRDWWAFASKFRQFTDCNMPAFNDGNSWPRVSGILKLMAEGVKYVPTASEPQQD